MLFSVFDIINPFLSVKKIIFAALLADELIV